ncbi:MAG: DUF6263 family protein [Phycisphaerales bacterium]
MKPLRRLVALSALSIASACFAADKVDLKPKFAKDNETKWVLDEKTNGNLKQGENARKAEQNQTLHLTRKVTAVDETSATIELTITRVVAEVTPPMGGDKLTFDSDQPADKDAGNMLALQFRQMVGQPYVFTVALNGDITAVKPPETVLSSDSADALKIKFGPLFQIKPGETLAAIGETWERNDPVGGRSGVALESKSKMTLSEVKDDVATIAIAATLAFKEGQTPPGMELKESGTKGDIRWSMTDGSLVELKTVQAMEMTNADMGLEVISATETHLRRE